MSFLNKDGTTIYDHLNEEPLAIPVTMDALAEMVEMSNYGTVRFLAALVRVRKARLAKRVEAYRTRGDHDIARDVERRGDAIVVAIESLLMSEEF